MGTQQADLLTDLGNENHQRRKSLLPVWIKIFMWIFLIMGAIVPFVFLIGILNGHFETSCYGMESTDALSATGIFILAIILLKGITALGLLKEQNWAIKLAIADAIIGILVCIFMMVSGDKRHSLRFELVALIPYLLKMLKIKSEWESIPDLEPA